MQRAAVLLAALALPACTDSGEVLTSEPPGSATPRALALSTGDEHGCAIVDGSIFCWGANALGQLGLGDTEDRDRPNRVDSELTFQELAAGSRHTCALSTTREVFCFGDNSRGQLGRGTRTGEPRPARVAFDRPVTELVCHFEHCCALADDASLWCWGKNDEGELGQGDAFPSGAAEDADQLAPVPIGSARFRAVATGQGHTCAIRDDGSMWCWGRNSFHELGPETLDQVRAPLQVGADTDWQDVVAGQHHSCGVRADRSLWCWGRNTALQNDEGFPLGVGAELVEEPTRVPLPAAVAAVGTDTFHSCAVDREGKLWCWGRNVEGQLGLSGRELRRTPELVGTGFSLVDPGRFSTCALSLDKIVLCAGNNPHGELGTADTVQREKLSPLAWFSL